MTRKPRRYHVRSDAPHRCTLTYLDCSEEVTREFWTPSDGGYVYEVSESHPGFSGRQISEYLSYKGLALLWSGSDPLAQIIRREARKAYAAEARLERSYSGC